MSFKYNLNDFIKPYNILTEVNKQFNKIKLNVENTRSILHCAYKQGKSKLPYIIYYTIAEFVGNDDGSKSKYVIAKFRNLKNKQKGYTIIDMNKDINTEENIKHQMIEMEWKKINDYNQQIINVKSRIKQHHQ